jgi:hypothetical protein
MNDDDEKYTYVSKQAHVNDLVERIDKEERFAGEFKFSDRTLFITLLESLGIGYEDFTKKYYHFDKDRHLHITESEFKYVWISTYGLIAQDKATTNKEVNACVNQFTVVSLLLDKSIEICSSEQVYLADSSNFGALRELSPALFHNILFYVEVFCKAYMSMCNVNYPHSHAVALVYAKLLDTMHAQKHNDSLFHALIVAELAKIVEYVTTIPGDFREHFVKYDDNEQDNTVIIFDPEHLGELKEVLGRMDDFICEYFYMGEEPRLVKQGFYQILLDKCKNEDEKSQIRKMYGYLIS